MIAIWAVQFCQRDVSLLVLETTPVSDPMLDPTVEIPEIPKFSKSRNGENFAHYFAHYFGENFAHNFGEHFVSKRCVFFWGSGRYPYFPKCANKHVFEELESKATRWRKIFFQKKKSFTFFGQNNSKNFFFHIFSVFFWNFCRKKILKDLWPNFP